VVSRILGIIWAVLGLLWTIKPEALKVRVSRKMSRKMRRIVFFFILIFSLMLIGSVVKADGLIPKIAGILGMIVMIKSIMLVTSATTEKFTCWWGGRPLIFFRIWGLTVLTIGLMLFFS